MGTVGAGAVIARYLRHKNAEACNTSQRTAKPRLWCSTSTCRVLDQLPALTALVVWNESDVPKTPSTEFRSTRSASFSQLGNSVNESLVEERMTVQQPGHCCSLIYTSGTTGPPKAAMISHDNLTSGSYLEQTQYGSTPSGFGLRFCVADYLILSKIRHALGLDECTTFLTGAAPTSLEVMRFFASLNMPLYELYGQTESTGPLTFSMPNKWNTLVATSSWATFNDEEATKKTVDENGWLYSGDIGELDEDGFLSITGRLKELIITFGGENIPPVLIENEIKAELPALSNVIVIGEKRNYLTFLCSLRVEPDAATGAPPTNWTRWLWPSRRRSEVTPPLSRTPNHVKSSASTLATAWRVPTPGPRRGSASAEVLHHPA
ncbi:AMP-binding, conserved site [Phytophthora cactorum]|nr:AMP-binding, conserved site [Phytophthora cactorum]